MNSSLATIRFDTCVQPSPDGGIVVFSNRNNRGHQRVADMPTLSNSNFPRTKEAKSKQVEAETRYSNMADIKLPVRPLLSVDPVPHFP